MSIEDLPRAGAVVVLGDGLAPPAPPRHWMNLDADADRILHAARLHRAGKARWVVATGGGPPWRHADQRPAQAMADLLQEWGVPIEAIVVEPRSRNTYENALFVQPILEERGIGDVLLVTSAVHMPRALAVFRSAGIRAIPAATDYGPGTIDRTDPLNWLPQPWALLRTSNALKERLGAWVYARRGWIGEDAR